jgi:hypothetical protein
VRRIIDQEIYKDVIVSTPLFFTITFGSGTVLILLANSKGLTQQIASTGEKGSGEFEQRGDHSSN